jgi:hypothetical protein
MNTMRTPILAMTLLFSWMTALPLSAQPIDISCTADLLCDGSGECRTVDDPSLVFRITGTQASSGIRSPRLKGPDFDIRLSDVAKERSYFSTYAGFTPDYSSILFSLHVTGFILTQHGVWPSDPNANGEFYEGSPSARTYYGGCTGLSEDEN